MTRGKQKRSFLQYRESLRHIGYLPEEWKERLRAKARARGFEIPDKAFDPFPTGDPLPVDHPVIRLLAHPSAVVDSGDRNNWPTAQDLESGAQLLAEVWSGWLGERAMQAGGAWADPTSHEAAILSAVMRWPAPFPVGRECLEWTVEDFAPLRELMPFPGDEHAALILREHKDGKEHVIFVLAQLAPFELITPIDVDRPELSGTLATDQPMKFPEQWVYAGTMRLIVNGRVRARCKPWKWVLWLAGRSVRDGKPLTERQGLARGRQKWNTEYLALELQAYHRVTGHEPPSLEVFLDHLQQQDRPEDFDAVDAWKRFKFSYGLTWGKLKAMVYSTAKKR